MPKQGTRASSIGSTSPNLLLDDVTGASWAFSLRKVRTAYSGSAIRVIRSSDSAESDIGFTSQGYLDIAGLTSFLGANIGYVKTWYDQSGNGFDVTMASSPYNSTTYLPKITNGAGAVYTMNGLPALYFDKNDRLIYNTLISSSYGGSTTGECTSAVVTHSMSAKAQHAQGGLQHGNDPSYTILYDYTNIMYFDAGNNSTLRLSFSTPGGWDNTQHVVTGFGTGSNMYVDIDGTNAASNAISATVTHADCYLTVGAIYNTETSAWSGFGVLQGYMQEYIQWNSNKFSDRTTINDNLTSFWL